MPSGLNNELMKQIIFPASNSNSLTYEETNTETNNGNLFLSFLQQQNVKHLH